MIFRRLVKFPRRLIGYIYYHLVSKKLIHNYVLDLSADHEIISLQSNAHIFRANLEQITWIKEVLFPELNDEQEYDKKYFELIGKEGVSCILVECNRKIIHYSFLFTDIKLSPLAKISPKIVKLFAINSAFLGPVFTLQEYRGYVFTEVLSYVLNYLIHDTKIEKLLICLYQKNPGAENFYKRLGFRGVDN